MDNIIWMIMVAVAVLGAVVLHVYIWKRYHYVCPKCSHCFKPTFLRSFTAVNAAQYRKMRCPNCDTVDYMQTVKNRKMKG